MLPWSRSTGPTVRQVWIVNVERLKVTIDDIDDDLSMQRQNRYSDVLVPS